MNITYNTSIVKQGSQASSVLWRLSRPEARSLQSTPNGRDLLPGRNSGVDLALGAAPIKAAVVKNEVIRERSRTIPEPV